MEAEGPRMLPKARMGLQEATGSSKMLQGAPESSRRFRAASQGSSKPGAPPTLNHERATHTHARTQPRGYGCGIPRMRIDACTSVSGMSHTHNDTHTLPSARPSLLNSLLPPTTLHAVTGAVQHSADGSLTALQRTRTISNGFPLLCKNVDCRPMTIVLHEVRWCDAAAHTAGGHAAAYLHASLQLARHTIQGDDALAHDPSVLPTPQHTTAHRVARSNATWGTNQCRTQAALHSHE